MKDLRDLKDIDDTRCKTFKRRIHCRAEALTSRLYLNGPDSVHVENERSQVRILGLTFDSDFVRSACLPLVVLWCFV